MKHTLCAVCAILEAPQHQFQPAKSQAKKKQNIMYKTKGGTDNWPTNLTSDFIFQSIYSF